MLKLLFPVLFCLPFHLLSQTGKISGTIIDAQTGETLPGATIFIEGTTKAAAADFDGKFTIVNVPAGKVVLVASYVSYTTKKIGEVEVKDGEVTEVNVMLEAAGSQNLEEVVVVVTLNRENNTAMVLQQKNNQSMSDGISAETIRQSTDRNSGDVLKRVSGVTMQDDRYVIVRGLNDRYNTAYLNNSALPSSEADRRAFAFNLFPSNMLEGITINKTATPDMPAEFAGGIIQVNTKSIPEKNFFSINAGLGYNTITTGQSQYQYKGGRFDQLGFDDGSRDLPADLPALKDKQKWVSNSEQARVARLFPNDWQYSHGKFAPNVSAQLSAGYNFVRKEKDFAGILFSLTHYQTQSKYNVLRTEYEELDVNGRNLVIKPKEQEYLNEVHQAGSSTSALLNLAIKPNENHSISLKNLFSGTTDNRFIHSNGTNNYNEQNIIQDRINIRYFTANQMLSSQLNSTHLLAAPKLKISFNTGFSNIKCTVPNMRFSAYGKYTSLNDFDPSEGPNLRDTMYRAYVSSASVGPDYSGFRVYQKLNENLLSSRLDLSRNFKLGPDHQLELKTGAYYQHRQRQYDMRRFGLVQYSSFQGQPVFFNDSLLYLPEDRIFATENMGALKDGKGGGFKAVEDTRPDDNYSARGVLRAAYIMDEYRYKEKIRLITGVRYEDYRQVLSVQYGIKDSVYVDNSIADILPSVNFVYNITEKLGLRLAYYKTLNRPEFRELAAANWYDPETRLSVAGNPNLRRSYIQNFDARFEVYPGRGQLLTVTGFYKYFKDPIERYMYPGNAIQVYYNNADFARITGTELEYRLNLGSVLKKDSVKFLKNLTIFSNLSFMRSVVNVASLDDAVPETRPMQGQAPYIINGGLSYHDKERQFSISAMVNRVGPRLYLVGSNIIPNRWENPRTVVDCQFTKNFFKEKLELRFNIRDLLHQDWIIYYKGTDRKDNRYQPGNDYANFVRNYGSTYSFSIGYRF